VWAEAIGRVVIAMAGVHQLWSFDPRTGAVAPLAGTMAEGLLDGPLAESWFAQPSGLAADHKGRIWVADSETSALRVVEFEPGADVPRGTVSSAIGEGLFDFGFRDGDAPQARLQHPLGASVLPDDSIAIADTYNGAVRRYDPVSKRVTTLAEGLAEPSDLVVVPGAGDAPDQLLVVESTAHRVVRIQIPEEVREIDGGVHRTQRPPTDIAPGKLLLNVPFTPATGQKLDDRFGPSTLLRVSATPPQLLVSGAGDSEELQRELVIAGPESGITEGVLHVTAHAASCDDDPAVEFPACHMNQQDWGVPIKIVDGAASELRLPLHG